MDAIGIRMAFIKHPWPELMKMAEGGKLPMWSLGWSSWKSTPYW